MREDYGKLFFNILDYTGSATRQFADPNFDGFPEIEKEETVDEEGKIIGEVEVEEGAEASGEEGGEEKVIVDVWPSGGKDGEGEVRKFYVDGGQVKIAAHLVLELDAEGNQLRTVQYTDYTASKVRTLFTSADELKERWANPLKREEVLLTLAERGINFATLAETMEKPDADPFDLLCHLAFNTPVRTRKERAEQVRQKKQDFFMQYQPEAQAILNALLDKYCDFGPQQLVIPDVLHVSPFSSYGNVMEIAGLFGGAPKLKAAVDELQTLLYAA